MDATSLPTWIGFASGASAGLVDTLLNYPPYSLHYRLGRGAQIYDRRHWRRYWTPRELYRGVLAYSAIIPVTCLTDGLTDYLKAREVSPPVASFSSGMLAAVLISAPTGNLIVTDQRLKEGGSPAGLRRSARDVWLRHGWRGFYTGLQPLMVREGLYAWAVFYAKNYFSSHYGLESFPASACAGTLAALLSQPTDTLATYMQNQTHRPSVSQAARAMWAQEGLRRFYRGFLFRWVAIISGVYFMDKVSQATKEVLVRKYSKGTRPYSTP